MSDDTGGGRSCRGDEADLRTALHRHLPRLDASFYRRDAVVLWTLTTKERRKGWLDRDFGYWFRELLVHTGARYDLVCPVYVLMPDHLHLIWMGTSIRSDQRVAMAFLRRFLKRRVPPVEWQRPPHDRVLREDDRKRGAFQNACWYLAMNPVRAGLCAAPGEWAYCGTVVAGFPELDFLSEGFWGRFWKIYVGMRARGGV